MGVLVVCLVTMNLTPFTQLIQPIRPQSAQPDGA